MGSFGGLFIGASGLGAQRRGVEVAGQNIANVNTDGYTRQRVSIEPAAGQVRPALHSTWNGTGLGVRAVEFQRLRDIFLDRRSHEETARRSELQARTDTFRSIEDIFNEPSDSGLSSVLADFFAGWDDVANSPDDVAARAQLAERGRTLATDINQIRRSLSTLQDVNRSRVESIIEQVNVDAAQVARLQDTIQTARASGLNANELLDQRDALLQGIAEKVGGTARHEPDGSVTFFVGSVALIRGSNSYAMEVNEVGGATEVVWPLDGRDVGLGGEAAGLLETINSLIPDYQSQVDAIAADLRDTVNAVHVTGFDLNGDPGLDFFVDTPEGLAINPAILDDPELIAASNTAGDLDGSVALQIAGLTGVDETYNEVIVRLGVLSQAAQRRQDLQDSVVQQVTFEQEASNGVNLDEELSDLVRFQRAYESNARFISAVDEMLNTLVNGTGQVGR